MKPAFSRQQVTTATYGVLSVILMLVVLQLWLLTATMNAFLGGDEAVIWPAALASLACYAVTAYLLRTLRRISEPA